MKLRTQGAQGHRIVVVGTGTGVGKTHVSVALALRLRTRGERVAALKPVETGVEHGKPGPDAARLERAAEFHVKHPCYPFAPPISPHLAARRAATSIDPSVILGWVERHDAPWQIVETAGGLLSPLTERVANVDLAAQLAPQALVLVAPNRIGVLHDVAVCVRFLRAELPELEMRTQVVLCAQPEPDSSSASNAAELATLGVASEVVEFPRRPPEHPASARVAQQLLARLATA